jgi:multidrug resistance efflux pump
MKKILRPAPTAAIGLVVLVASIIGATWVLRSGAGEGTPPTEIKQAGLNSRDSDFTVTLGYADVEPKITPVLPVLAGRVQEVFVKEDDIVKAGDRLLKLDDSTAKFNVERAEAALRDARLLLETAQKAPEQHLNDLAAQQKAIQVAQDKLAAATAHATHLKGLEKSQLANAFDAQAAEAAARAAAGLVDVERIRLETLKLVDPQNQIERAEADVRDKKAQLDTAQYALKECTVVAPIDGKVLRVLAGRGELVGPQSPQPVIQLAPAKPRIIRAELEQEFAARVAVGDTARIEDDSHANIHWTGKVIRMSDWFAPKRNVIREPLQFNDVRTLECIIGLELKPKQDEPRIGQRVRVIIERKTPTSVPPPK